MKKMVLVAMLLALIVSLGYCQDQPLQLTIKADKGVYKKGDSIIINYEIKNIGKDDVKLLLASPIAEIIDRPVGIFIKERNWKERYPIWAAVDYYPGVGSFQQIDLVAETTYSKKMNITKFHYFDKDLSYSVHNVRSANREKIIPDSYMMDNFPEGEYEITAEYNLTEAMERSKCSDSLGVKCWHGNIVSNPITIRIA